VQLVCIVTPRCCYDDSETFNRCNAMVEHPQLWCVSDDLS
jgi:hypothetical protein